MPPPKPKVEAKKTVRFDKQTTKKLPPDPIADQETSKPEENKEGEG